MKIDAVFSGGGVKGYAFIGVLQSLANRNIEIERVAGTSAGAIVAAFIAAGYQHDEMETMLAEVDLKTFLDPPEWTRLFPVGKWFFFYYQLGLYKGKALENWLYEQLAKKSIYTFADLPEGYLKVVVSDLTLGKLVVIPDDLNLIYGMMPEHFPVAKAVRMSAGFPYFFIPQKLAGKTKEKSIIVDGGLLSNFPLWIFDKDRTRTQRPVLGVKLSESMERERPRKIKNAFDMLTALFSTMKQAHDMRYVSKSEKNNIIFVPVDRIETTDFHISEEMKRKLIKTGLDSSNQFLKFWPK